MQSVYGFQILRSFVSNCLKQADQKGYQTISFPAIGTGNLGIPRPTVAKWMYDEVIQYSRNNPTAAVKAVNFVLYNKDRATVQVSKL